MASKIERSPFFTVVVPTYNRGHLLINTINTILNQNFDDFELIVVDDGSTDNTKEVISQITDPRFTYHKKDNAERGAARNKGAALSRGQYINFIDSDDVIYENHLETAREFIDRHDNPEVFHLAYDVKDQDGNLIRKVDNLPEVLNDILITGNHLSCNGVFIGKDVIVSHAFNEDRRLSAAEDYELWLRLASRFSFLNYNVVTSTVINHDHRSVIQTDKDKLIERVMLLISLLTSDQKFQAQFSKKTVILKSNLMAYIALHLAMTKKNRLDSVKFLFKAIKHNTSILFTRRFLGVIKNLI